MRMDLVVTAAAEANLLQISSERVEFMEIDGKPAAKTKPPEQLFPAMALASAMATMVVYRNGLWKEVRDLDQVIDRVKHSPEMARFTRETLETFYSSPSMRDQIAYELADNWNIWVAFWLSANVEPGGSRDSVTVMALPDGSKVEFPRTARNHGALPDQPGRVRFSYESVIDGEPAVKYFTAELATLLADPRFRKGTKVVSAFSKRTADVIVDPTTMRPDRSRITSEKGFVLSTGQKDEGREVRETVFDWSKAQGCNH